MGAEVLVAAVCDVSEERDGARVSRGLVMDGPVCLEALLPAGARPEEEWGEGQARVVWVDDEGLTVITYCEGDVSVVECDSRTRYYRELGRHGQYYRGLGDDGLFHGRR